MEEGDLRGGMGDLRGGMGDLRGGMGDLRGGMGDFGRMNNLGEIKPLNAL